MQGFGFAHNIEFSSEIKDNIGTIVLQGHRKKSIDIDLLGMKRLKKESVYTFKSFKLIS